MKQAGNAGFLHAPQQRLPVDQIDHRFAAQLGLGRDDVHRFPNAGHHLAVIDTHSNLVVAARTQKLVRLEDKRRLPDLIGLQARGFARMLERLLSVDNNACVLVDRFETNIPVFTSPGIGVVWDVDFHSIPAEGVGIGVVVTLRFPADAQVRKDGTPILVVVVRRVPLLGFDRSK